MDFGEDTIWSLTAWERKNQKFEKKMNTSITLMTFTGKAKP